MTTTESGRVAGKVCLVTGGTSGIGEGIARHLAAEGAHVIVAGRRVALGEQVAADIVAQGGEAIFLPVDVTDPARCEQLIEQAHGHYGRLDGMVHNAGLSRRGTVIDTSIDDWHAVLDTNVTAAFLLAKAAIPLMQAQGGGSIVHIGSAHTALPKRNMAAYCASRGALLMLSRQMAVEYIGDRIRVNVVNPGWVDTPGERELLQTLGQSPDVMDMAARANPFGRLLSPRDIAVVISYLLSDDSELVTGSVFDIHHEHPLVV
ncbi:MAG: SDR family oxidoreductase [Armatimonadetes bacterium]|nr:SDR family oxidoreductase [Armatimonadota bacterium]